MYILSILSLYFLVIVALFIFKVGVSSFIAKEKSLSSKVQFCILCALETAFAFVRSKPAWIAAENPLEEEEE